MYNLEFYIKWLDWVLFVFYFFQDMIVGIENVRKIYEVVMYFKSYILLDGVDYLFMEKKDSWYVGNVIVFWVECYFDFEECCVFCLDKDVVVWLGQVDVFIIEIIVCKYGLIVDEFLEVGGNDFGFLFYEFLLVGLGVCMVMMLCMYVK